MHMWEGLSSKRKFGSACTELVQEARIDKQSADIETCWPYLRLDSKRDTVCMCKAIYFQDFLL